MPFVPTKVKALGVVLLNRYGARFYSKYYLKHTTTDLSKGEHDITTQQGRIKLQKSLYQKIKKGNIASGMTPERTQIFSYAGFSVLFKVVHELYILLICEEEQNFVLMEQVINCIGNVLPLISAEQYVQKVVEDNLDSIIISVDEILDQGIILCLDQNLVFDRIKMREGSDKKQQSSNTKKPAQQQQSTSAFNSLFGFAKNTLQKTLNLG